MTMRVRTLAAAVACAAVLAGCFAGDPERATPAGFVRYRGEGYTFAYPAGWTLRRATDERGHQLLHIDGPDVTPGVSLGQVSVGRERPAKLPFEEQLGQYRALSVMSGRKVSVDREVKVSGAERAHRFEAVQPVRTSGGQPAQLQIIDIYVLTEDRTLLDFVVRAPEGGAATARLPEVLASFQVRPVERGQG
ncbi:hypothetical protein [Actinomadura sp. HBU206391]|uniref:hypothetical protein n=1 Tax=Actinomadura sp. HBU206391 TaxID=2731692 RepID=UPI00164EFFC2|nr:hypothetical protein [Actinomadura sp. HBU206391]MBC6457757.1 hypothetical protein [Actinomadura sp. HBU206391]